MAPSYEVERPKSKAPEIKNHWHKTTKISNITIIYGVNGEKSFEGHHSILCNASDHSIFVSVPVISSAESITNSRTSGEPVVA